MSEQCNPRIFTRREFIQFASAGTFGAALLPSLISCAKEEIQFDNVVVLIGDDHAAHAVGCYDNEIIRTPNIDNMAYEGLRFEYAYANAPLCSASRQSILTGRYPHAAGVTLLRTPFPEEQVTIAEHLQANGFATALIGKAHFNNNLSHGFQYRVDSGDYREWLEENPPKPPPDDIETRPPWRPFRDPARIWLNADMRPSEHYDEDSEGTYYARKAIDFIKKNRENRFCMFVGFHEPHSPFNFPIEYAGKYDPDQMPLPEGSPEDDRWIPLVFKDLSEDERRGIIASYYTSVEYLDKIVGLIVDAIAESGLSDNTLVIYIGDQGYLLGHHKRFEKHMMWEQAIRSPLVLYGGSKLGNGQQVFRELTEFIDLTPSILDMLKLQGMETVQGKSFFPLINGETGHHKDIVFSEFLVDNKAMVRNDTWKYIFTSGKRDLGQGYETGNPAPGITHRLYNLEDDPQEHRDVSSKAENQEILITMQDEMLNIFRETHPDANKLPEGLSREEQLVWFCVPVEENPNLEAK